MRPKKVYINGRFLRGPITGTSRVAEEVLTTWDNDIAAGDDRFSGFNIEILAPKDAQRELNLANIKTTRKGIVGGKLWEVLDLGLLASRGILVNFANISPLLHPHCLTYIHDAQIFLFPASYPRSEVWTHQPLAKIAGRVAQRVITVSEFSSQMIERFGIAKKEKIRVIHNGADHIYRSAPDQSVLQTHGLTPHGYVLMLGSAFSYKNTEIIYEAFKLMGAGRPKLAVIARADLRKALSVEALGDDLVILSNISDGALRALYENALVFVQPAKTEGFAMTQLEALNSGAPVITSPEGSMPEVLAQDVTYVDADSADSWKEAILRFKTEPGLRESQLERGRKMAARYTWRRTAASLWEQVSDVAGGKPATVRR